MRIPKVFHTVWLGANPLPDFAKRYAVSWRENHPEWEWNLWTEENLPGFCGGESFEQSKSLAQKADIVRYQLLYHSGGVYVDTDMECLKCIEPLLDEIEAFVGTELPGRPSNAIMGAVPGHPLFKKLVEDLPSRQPYRGNPVWETGPLYLAAGITGYLGENPVGEDIETEEGKPAGAIFNSELLILEPWVFYPYFMNHAWVPNENPDSFAVHHWAQSWKSSGASGLKGSTGPERGKLFDRIYSEQVWAEGGAAPLSGPGSSARSSQAVCALVDSLQVNSVVDVGCGDFEWAQNCRSIQERRVSYLGIDISSHIVNRNRGKYPQFNFMNLDAAGHPFSVSCDLLMAKDIVPHLDNPTLLKLLENFSGSEWKYCILTSYPGTNNFIRNFDSYYFAPVDLCAPPFNMAGIVQRQPRLGGGEFLLIEKSGLPSRPVQEGADLRYKLFAIGLPRYRERWTAAIRRLGESGISFELVNGYDAACLKPDILQRSNGGWSLSDGEVGCYLSHLHVAQRIVDYDLDYGIVLEDDFLWCERSYLLLEEVIQTLPPGTDHVQLHNFRTHFFPSYRILGEMGRFNVVRPTNVITTGYIMSKRLATELLAHHQVPDRPIDHKYIQLSYRSDLLFLDVKERLIDVDWDAGSSIPDRGKG